MSTAAVTARRVATVISGKELAGDTEFTTIQAAINYAATQSPSAANPWTIYIYPGIYDEIITLSDWVNLRGVGPPGSVVIYQLDVTPIGVTAPGDTYEMQNLTLRLGTPSVQRGHIYDSQGVNLRLTDIIFEVTTPGAFQIYVLFAAGAGNFILERCYHRIGGTGASFTIRSTSWASTFHLVDNDFAFSNVNAYHIYSSVAGTWTGHGNRWAGTCGMFNVTDGTFTFDNDALLATAAWTNTDSIMILRHCAIEAPVVAGNVAWVRLKNCSYRAIQRAGTGKIVDESPRLRGAPWHVEKWTWQALLANAQVAVRGTPVDGGAGQVLLEVTDNAADQEAVERSPEAAGALGNELDAPRIPRFLTKISVDSFDLHVTMFFGLRRTLANAVPGGAENHAGFIWDGTNFKSSSSNAVGITENNLTIPTVNTQVQLELIIQSYEKVFFYVDGVLVATHTSKIPGGALDWQHLLQTGGLGGGDLIQVTVRDGGVQECPS